MLSLLCQKNESLSEKVTAAYLNLYLISNFVQYLAQYNNIVMLFVGGGWGCPGKEPIVQGKLVI